LPYRSTPLTSPAHAIALASIPVVVSNAWQAFHGGHTKDCIRRFWPMLSGVVLGAVIGVQILATFDQQLVSGILGIVLVVFTGLQAMPHHFSLDAMGERWLGPPLGLVAACWAACPAWSGRCSSFTWWPAASQGCLRRRRRAALLHGLAAAVFGLVAHGILSPSRSRSRPCRRCR
jgi:uncharacterized membrane protein YfcA